LQLTDETGDAHQPAQTFFSNQSKTFEYDLFHEVADFVTLTLALPPAKLG
jgi:hypothetical protein